MDSVSPRSSKDAIWREKERLEREAQDEHRRALVLEERAETLGRDVEHLRERAELAETLEDELRA